MVDVTITVDWVVTNVSTTSVEVCVIGRTVVWDSVISVVYVSGKIVVVKVVSLVM